MTADLDMTKRDNLIVHIEGLQATLTKRNARIAELEAFIAGEGKEERDERALKNAYKKGWNECAMAMGNGAQAAIVALGNLRREALAKW